MRIWIESIYDVSVMLRKVRKSGLMVSRKTPDYVIAYGGDGTILAAESKYPGTPKIPLSRSMICSKCVYYRPEDLGTVLDKLDHGKFRIARTPKVEASFNGRKLAGLNEVQVRNKDQRRALRFSLQVDGRKSIFIADGLVASTPYGSTGYYNSLGYAPFPRGIRIGLNNPTTPRRHYELKKSARVRILRETGVLTADNQPALIELKKGGSVTIRESEQMARFVYFL